MTLFLVAWRLFSAGSEEGAFVHRSFSIFWPEACFYGLALIWNRTDAWVTRGSIYALASTTPLWLASFMAYLVHLLLPL
jgi:hypothetical protein